MRSFVALLVLTLGCVHPAPPPPKPEPPKPEAKIPNRAAEVCALGASKLDPEARCSMWSGRETLLPDEVDAVVCVGSTWIMYCEAPDNDRPRFFPVLEWPKAPDPAPPAVEKPTDAKPRAAKK